MHIRAEQIAAMADASEALFLDRVVELVTQEVELEERDPEIRDKCRQLIQRARALGLTTEFEVATYTACGCAFGIDFDTRSDLPFQRILLEPDTDPLLKAAQMAAAMESADEDEGPPPEDGQ